MDKAVPWHYFFLMLRTWMIIFSVIAFAAVSFTAAAHETGMVDLKDLGAQMQHKEHTSSLKASCIEGKTCAAETALCDLVCTGIAVFLPSNRASSSAIGAREIHLRHPDAAFVAVAPNLNDRPPILRLL